MLELMGSQMMEHNDQVQQFALKDLCELGL
jgi:hypothetical protein